MTADAIRNLLHATPFAPFSVHVAHRKSLHIEHPEFATLARGGRLLFVNTEGDGIERAEAMLITRVNGALPEPAG
ncbi:MAG: hypothetical protein M3463_21370 [Verrucomicrobiota bacterium]|nr:hypothetical protein [Verrucomicrobiota bacterium]